MQPALSADTVVVVEDVPSSSMLLTIVLAKRGLQSVAFSNAESALEWLRLHQPALVLCDIMLPGMSGGDLLAQIRALPYTTSVPVIAVTALALDADRTRLLAMGFDGYLAKPVNIAALTEVIAQHASVVQ